MSQNDRKPFSYFGSQPSQNYQTPFLTNYSNENRSTGLFGQKSAADAPTSAQPTLGTDNLFKSGFGANTNPFSTTNNYFSADNKTTTYPSTTGFGAPATRYTPMTSGTTYDTSGYSSFKAPSTTYDYTKPSWLSSTEKRGSSVEAYKKTHTRDDTMILVELLDITAMNCYNGKSVDEIRYEDYELGRKRAVSKPLTTGAGLFGSVSGTGPVQPASTAQPSFLQGLSSTTPGSTIGSTTSNVYNPVSAPSSFLLNSRPADTTVQPTQSIPFQSQSLMNQPIQTQPFQTQNTSVVPPVPAQPSFMSAQPSMISSSVQPTTFVQPTALYTPQPYYTPAQPVSMPSAQPLVSNYNLEDPYLVEGLTFEHIEKPSIKLKKNFYKSIFNVREPDHKPFIRMNKHTNTKPYSIPKYEDVIEQNQVSNPSIVFPGKGKIEFLESLDSYLLREENIQKYVFDSRGVSNVLGKRARVYVENVKPTRRENVERFVYELKNDKFKKFVDYNVEDGIYVYESDKV
ncbi:Nuclear pore complex, Nup98 component (sc Nup145/Nup100/Nup116) [Trachipleistophora hominis]|uniref:Nuclear pore complex, Nup98 component (Sc Nup145/Nup100/Nup116) n=1 Tax=Trachipleistophora hominis TaxID=72359 RepID=L7JWU6_TRAHO|nr:Nuclear pore complex, Nup98 component (sc Nup145/Nup100/Nup116) [Trachipleistophora hominis]